MTECENIDLVITLILDFGDMRYIGNSGLDSDCTWTRFDWTGLNFGL